MDDARVGPDLTNAVEHVGFRYDGVRQPSAQESHSGGRFGSVTNPIDPAERPLANVERTVGWLLSHLSGDDLEQFESRAAPWMRTTRATWDRPKLM